jgi:hypothetical protein
LLQGQCDSESQWHADMDTKWWPLGHSFVFYLLCEINSSDTYRLTFSKLCTIVMNTLEMCMWLSGSFGTFSVGELSHFSNSS